MLVEIVYLVFFISLGFLFGLVGVASNPSPCFGAGALVIASGFGCGVLAELGYSFIALILFLVYLGGMLVVFVYSIALASDVYPQAWGNFAVGLSGLGYFLVVVIVGVIMGYLGLIGGEESLICLFGSGYGGIAMLYSVGGSSLFILGVSLLVTLFVVLELVRGDRLTSRGG